MFSEEFQKDIATFHCFCHGSPSARSAKNGKCILNILEQVLTGFHSLCCNSHLP